MKLRQIFTIGEIAPLERDIARALGAPVDDLIEGAAAEILASGGEVIEKTSSKLEAVCEVDDDKIDQSLDAYSVAFNALNEDLRAQNSETGLTMPTYQISVDRDPAEYVLKIHLGQENPAP